MSWPVFRRTNRQAFYSQFIPIVFVFGGKKVPVLHSVVLKSAKIVRFDVFWVLQFASIDKKRCIYRAANRMLCAYIRAMLSTHANYQLQNLLRNDPFFVVREHRNLLVNSYLRLSVESRPSRQARVGYQPLLAWPRSRRAASCQTPGSLIRHAAPYPRA